MSFSYWTNCFMVTLILFCQFLVLQSDNAKLGSAGGSPQCLLAEGFVAEELLGHVPGFVNDEYLSRVPENSWTVPEVPSPPTASGLNWHGNLHFPAYDSTMFVPEVSSLQGSQNQFAVPSGLKRRRRQYWVTRGALETTSLFLASWERPRCCCWAKWQKKNIRLDDHSKFNWIIQ
jgi:hypothetical protein